MSRIPECHLKDGSVFNRMEFAPCQAFLTIQLHSQTGQSLISKRSEIKLREEIAHHLSS